MRIGQFVILNLTFKNLLICLTTLFALPSFAFDSDKCGDLFPKTGDNHPPYYAPIYSTTIAPSITSYFSSFGKCSMYGSGGSVKAYIAQTYQHISFEAARGGGEYVSTLAALSGCPTNLFIQRLHTHYKDLFTEDEKNFDLRLDTFIRTDSVLAPTCEPRI